MPRYMFAINTSPVTQGEPKSFPAVESRLANGCPLLLILKSDFRLWLCESFSPEGKSIDGTRRIDSEPTDQLALLQEAANAAGPDPERRAYSTLKRQCSIDGLESYTSIQSPFRPRPSPHILFYGLLPFVYAIVLIRRNLPERMRLNNRATSPSERFPRCRPVVSSVPTYPETRTSTRPKDYDRNAQKPSERKQLLIFRRVMPGSPGVPHCPSGYIRGRQMLL